MPELNRRPSNYESDALPTELSRLRREFADARKQLHYTNAVFAVSSGTDRTHRRDVMPKDATKNVDRYKVRGGQLNEFELAENRKALAGRKAKGGAKLIPGTPPEEADEGLQARVKAKATTKSTKPSKATKGTKASKAPNAAKANSSKGATAKKLAARKAAKKK